MTRERQNRKKAQTKKEILQVAKNIIEKEGLEGLSVRKLTNTLDYSPAIIYHYFKDKDEIINTLVFEGYQRILKLVMKNHDPNKDPITEIEDMFTAYIKSALDNMFEYKTFMLSENEEILKYTKVLSKDISLNSKTMAMLKETLQRGIDEGIFKDEDPELMAQIIWSQTFGLIIRMMIENIDEKQRNRLINEHFNIILSGIKK